MLQNPETVQWRQSDHSVFQSVVSSSWKSSIVTMSRQVFFFCTLYDGNATTIYRCRSDAELCCGRGCCLSMPEMNSVWSQWYFWLGVFLFAVLVIVISLILSSIGCCSNRTYSGNSNLAAVSRYGIRHILGVQNSSRTVTVAATGVTCGPTGLIQPSVTSHKVVPMSASDGDSYGMMPLRPPYPLRPTTKPPRTHDVLIADDVV